MFSLAAAIGVAVGVLTVDLVPTPPPPPVAGPDLVYTPITPCRAFGTATALAANSTSNFRITGSASLEAQGGPAAGCGIPASAKAVAISLTSVSAASSGIVTAFATNSPRPVVTSLVVSPITALTAGSVVQIGSGGQISAFASSSTKLFGDVTGYYAPAIFGEIESNGLILKNSGRIKSVTRAGQSVYNIELDADIRSCSVNVRTSTGFPHFALVFSQFDSLLQIETRRMKSVTPSGAVSSPQRVGFVFSVHC